MKRNRILLVCIFLLAALAACGRDNAKNETAPAVTQASPTAEAAPTAEATPTATSTPTPTATNTPTPTPDPATYRGSVEELNDLYDMAYEIGRKHGIEIYIADRVSVEAIALPCEQQMDPELVRAALTRIDEILSRYPRGMVRRLVTVPNARMELYLVKNMELYAGLYDTRAREDGGVANYVALDTRGADLIDNLDDTLPHELTHAADYSIMSMRSRGVDVKFSEDRWNELNPPGFEYAETGDFELQSDVYTVGDNYRYFAYSYGCMNRLEDRATLFGFLMHYAAAGSAVPDQFTPEQLAKLGYWIECLRDAYANSDWPEQTYWEKAYADCLGK